MHIPDPSQHVRERINRSENTDVAQLKFVFDADATPGEEMNMRNLQAV
jgi:hypothetical protein